MRCALLALAFLCVDAADKRGNISSIRLHDLDRLADREFILLLDLRESSRIPLFHGSEVDIVLHISIAVIDLGLGSRFSEDALTDNKNRTAANVRSAFSKGRGNIGTSGCVSFMFQKKGQIIVSKEEYETDPDEFMMIALDAGAEDFVEEDDSYEITTDPDAFGEVREALEKEGVPMASAEVTMIPDNYVTLTDPEDIKNLNRTLDLLDEDDDVQAVYHNWEEE